MAFAKTQLKALALSGLMALSASAALAETQINVIGWGAGFAWPDLFGPSGTEKTQLLLDFEKKYDIVVNMEYADEDVARQKVLFDLVNGTGTYDLVILGSDGAVQTYSNAGYIEPLDGYLDSAPELFDAAKVYPAFLEANRSGGKLWALPYLSYGAGAVYRKDIFEKYGITSFPTTIEGLEAAMQTIKDGLARDGITDVYPLAMRGAPGNQPAVDLTGITYAYAGGPSWFEGNAATPEEIRATKAQPVLNKGPFKEGFTTFVRWAQNFAPPGVATYTWVDMMNLYAQGKVAIVTPAAINAFNGIIGSQVPEVKDSSAFAPSVKGPSGKEVQNFWTFSTGISAYSRNKDAAFKVLALLSSEPVLENFASTVGWPFAPYPSVMHGPALTKRWPPELLDTIETTFTTQDPKYNPYIPEMQEINDKIGTAASAAISGTVSIDEALDTLQTEVTDIMKRAGYYD